MRCGPRTAGGSAWRATGCSSKRCGPSPEARRLRPPLPATSAQIREDGVAEAKRLEALDRYAILDTAPEQVFDDIVDVAARVCRAPMAAISLIDEARNWMKAAVGMNVAQVPRTISFCGRAIRRGGLVVVPDATLDPVFRDNPLVTGEAHIRFYAGAVLEAPDGAPLGALCVLDTTARPEGLNEDQALVLTALSRQVMTQLELRRALATEHAATARAEALARTREREVAELAASEERLALALHAGVIGTWDWDVARDRVYVDPELAASFSIPLVQAQAGVPLEAFIGGVHPDDRAWVHEAIRAAVDRGGEFAEEYRIVANGQVRWVMARGRGLLDEGGKPERFPGVVIDVTERRKAEEALREANASRELAMQAANLGRFDHDPSRELWFWDARVGQIFGLAGQPSLQTLLGRIHADDRDRVREGIARATRPDRVGVYAEEYRVVRDDGELRWISALGRSAFENGACVRFVGVVQDITTRKRAEELRRADELRAGLAIRAGALGIWEHRPASDERIWDDRARELFGMAPGAPVTGRTIMGAVHPDDRAAVLATIQEAVEPEASGAREMEFRTLDPGGALRWVAASGQAVREPGQDLRLIGTLRDITAQKLAEEHQRLLTNELNHRVKNTLSIVQALVAQTLRSASSPEDARRAVNDRLVVLGRAHDILTRTNWTAAPVAEVVASAVAPLSVEAGRVRVHGPARQLAPKVALSLAMALYELGTNAVKYGALSSVGGYVEIVWSVDASEAGPRFDLRWSEHGGPPVTPPERKGFGSRLVESALAAEFQGRTELSFHARGVAWTLNAPLEAVEA